MPALLCALEALVFLAIICLVLFVLWWAITSLLGAAGVAIPPQVITILKVIAVLIIVIFIVRALLTGDWCGYFGWAPRTR